MAEVQPLRSGSSGGLRSPKLGRALLTAQEISDLDAALMAAYRMHSELRARMSAAAYIARPPIPAKLSESLVGYSACWLFGAACRAKFGGRRTGLIIRRPSGDQLLVEVKATGAGEFQEVKPRDLEADALVWVAFGRRYEDARGPTHLYVLPEPSRFEPPTTRSGAIKRKFGLNAFLAGAKALMRLVLGLLRPCGQRGAGRGRRR